eukprot:GHUV01029575.1.p2 GENE.GHUV01029575.1~~GHUV01029575.1.p2  ORF type:complete len:131 (-),score=27.26 GHUV01029575.1:528-920(-)
MSVEFRIKFPDDQQDVLLTAAAEDTFAVVAQRLRACKGWNESQHVRLICGGQELYMDDVCSRATGNVLHCIPATQERHRGPERGKPEAQQAVDWVSELGRTSYKAYNHMWTADLAPNIADVYCRQAPAAV